MLASRRVCFIRQAVVGKFLKLVQIDAAHAQFIDDRAFQQITV